MVPPKRILRERSIELNSEMGIVVRSQLTGTSVTKKINTKIMQATFVKYVEGNDQPHTSWLIVENWEARDKAIVLIDMVHKISNELPAGLSLPLVMDLAEMATKGDLEMNKATWPALQDALLQYISADAPGSYIRESPCFLQYLVGLDKLTAEDATFPPTNIWWDLVSNVKVSDDGRLVTGKDPEREVTMFAHKVPIPVYVSVLNARKHFITNVVDSARRYMIRISSNALVEIAASVHIAGLLGVGFRKPYDSVPEKTDLDDMTIAAFQQRLEEACDQAPGPGGAILHYIKDTVVPKLANGDGPSWGA